MILGTLGWKTESDEYDEYGIRTVILSYRWAPAGNGRLEHGQASLLTIPSAPEGNMKPLVLVLPVRTVPAVGGLKTFYRFQGSDGLMLSARGNTRHCKFSGQWADQDLTLHPKWSGVYQTTYGGWFNDATGRIEWPATLSTGDTTSTMGMTTANGNTLGGAGTTLTAGSSGSKGNPMFGRQTYLHLSGGRYTHSYAVADRLPEGLFVGVSDLFTSVDLPGVCPILDASENRNWMKVTPEYESFGNAFRIDEHYDLSDVNGFPSQIYPVKATVG